MLTSSGGKDFFHATAEWRRVTVQVLHASNWICGSRLKG